MTKINGQKKIFFLVFGGKGICFDLFYFRFRMIDEMRPPSPPGVPHYSDGEVYHVQFTMYMPQGRG